jgi:hypothetical protein
MLFSTNQGNIKPQILFNNEDVEFVVNHKHELPVAAIFVNGSGRN